MNNSNNSNSNHKLIGLIMFFSIMGYFTFKTSYRYIGDIFQTLLYLGTLTTLYFNRMNILKIRAVQLFIISIFLQIISWYNLTWRAPEYPNVLSLTWFGYLFIFIFISYWIEGEKRKIQLTLISFVIGSILTCLLHSNNIIIDLQSILEGRRVDYNFMNANHSAALLATSLIIVTYLISSIKPSKTKTPFLISLSIIITILLTGTQSRSAYLSLAIPLLILGCYSLKKGRVNFFFTLTAILITVSAFTFSSLPRVNSEAGTFQRNYDTKVQHKPKEEKTDIEIIKEENIKFKEHNKVDSISKKIITNDKNNYISYETSNNDGNFRSNLIEQLDSFSEKVPFTSVGYRIHFWVDTIKQSLYTPFLGLGNNANIYILEHSKYYKNYNKYKFQHLHSSYMELIASYGLVGIILLAYLYSHVFKISKDRGSRDIFVFSICLYSFLGVLNLFESYLFVKSGVLIHTLVLGILYSYNFKGDIENERK